MTWVITAGVTGFMIGAAVAWKLVRHRPEYPMDDPVVRWRESGLI